MSQNRTQKSMKNLIFALVSQVLIIFVKFFTRTALIRTLGIEAVGINALLTEVVTMLSLAELGVGTAIVYNLYQPLADGDHDKISQYMGLFKRSYRYIALFIFLVGLATTPFIHLIVKDVSYTTNFIRVIYMLFVLQTAGSYLFSYKTALLHADQKNYIYSIIYISTRTVGAFLLVASLYLTGSLIIYLIINVTIILAINAIASMVVDRQYPYLNMKAVLPQEERKDVFDNVKNIFLKTVSGKITTSTDNILISTLVSTLQVGYYANYNIFFSLVFQLSIQFGGAITGSMGNYMATESNEKSADLLKRMTFLFYLISALGVLCLYGAITPFIKLWLGEEFLLEKLLVTILCYNSFLAFMRAPLWRIMNVSGLFKEDKNIAFIGTTANLIISITIGWFFGMIGIFLGTIISGLIQLLMKIRLLYKDRFHLSAAGYYKMWFLAMVSMVIQMTAMHYLGKMINFDQHFVQFMAQLCLGLVIFLTYNLIVYSRTNEFKYAFGLGKDALVGLKDRVKK